MDPGKDRPLDLPLNALGTMSQLYQVSLTLLEDAAEYLGSLCGSFPNGGRLPSYDGICGGAVFHVSEVRQIQYIGLNIGAFLKPLYSQ